MRKVSIMICILLALSLLALPLLGCSKALTLTVSQPGDWWLVERSPVTVAGKVSDAKATLKVNNVKVAVAKKGNFTTRLELVKGENTIKIEAKRGKDVVTQTLTVIYEPSA